MSAGAGRRQRAERAGRRAEDLACLLLRLKGYRVLDRRYRCAGGEIDVIARRGRLVCFVEVKARATREAALTAVTPRGRQRIERAARTWMARARLAPPSRYDVRFDLVTVVGRRPRHLKDAWRPAS